MALSYQNYTGDSVTTTFSIPFTYTDTSEISVTVDGVAQTGLTFPSASSVQLTSAPATSTLVQVRRTTDLTARAVDYVSGSVLTEEDLDNANIQVFHAVQESVDATGDTIALATDDKWDAQNKVIKNLANPVADTDAVNKQFISTNLPNINTVAGIASDVTTVARISSNVTTVAGNNTNVTTVASNIANVNTVANNISDVITVANDLNEAISEIETAALDLQEATSEIDVVANSIANVDTVGAAIANVNLTAASITDVNTVAADITNVNTVAGSVTNVNTVAGDITNVNNVAGNATNINTVAGNNANVTTVATDIANVNTVATSIANVNSVGTNIASVINASNSISSINNFGDTYFVSATAPSSPTLGDLWFDTTTNTMKVYTATGFANAGSSVNGTSERQTYTATGGQTSFAATYDAGYVDVYLNGVKLISGTDFTATDGANIVLASGATAGDTIDIVAFGTFDVTDVGGSLTTLGIDNHNLVTVDGSGNVDVTGTVTSDGLTVDGASSLNADITQTAVSPSFYMMDSNTTDLNDRFVNAGGTIFLQTVNDAKNTFTSRISVNNSTGDISFYDSTGTSQDLFWDASASRLGIGTTSPTGILETYSTSSAIVLSTTTTGYSGFRARSTSGNFYSAIDDSTGSAFGRGGYSRVFWSDGAYPMVFGVNSAERARIDSSGNLLVGKTSSNGFTAGGELRPAGDNFFTRASGAPLQASRLNSDGDIAIFYKDSTEVGSIGTAGGDFYVGNGSKSLMWTNNNVFPRSGTGGLADNTVDFGNASNRFNDAYITNGVTTGSDANEKQQIAVLTDAEIAAAKRISAGFKTFKWNDAVEAKGDNARTHTGVIAQEVQAALEAEGLDAGNYAFWMSDTWWETQTEVPAVEAVDEVVDEDGNVITEAAEAKEAYTRTDTYDTLEEAPEGATERTRLGIRYPELLAFIGAATEQRLASIEARLDALEA